MMHVRFPRQPERPYCHCEWCGRIHFQPARDTPHWLKRMMRRSILPK